MRCTHAEKLIPLFAGDDLPARKADALRRHLESCANCRRLAAEFNESRKWLRGFAAPQFDEAMLDDLRDSVLRGIGRVENRSRWLQWIVPGWNLRFASVTSLALLLLVAWFGMVIYRRQPSHDPKSNQAEAYKGHGNQVESPSNKNSNGRANNDKRTAKSNPGRRGPTRKLIKPGLNESQTKERMIEPDLIAHNKDTIQPANEPSAGPDPANTDPDANRDMLRIEIQTADPNIRIIWFAPKSEASSTTTPNTK
jgi:hypothetical protein